MFALYKAHLFWSRASNDNMKNCGVESNLASQCPSVGRPLSSRSAASCVDLSSNYRGKHVTAFLIISFLFYIVKGCLTNTMFAGINV